MNILKRSTPVMAALALVALAASQVQAAVGTCRNGNRTFPSGTETIVFKCRHNNSTTTVATLSATSVGGKKVSALLTAGGTGANAVAFGVDANGNAIPGCEAKDVLPVDAVTKTVGCAAAVQWRAQINFLE